MNQERIFTSLSAWPAIQIGYEAERLHQEAHQQNSFPYSRAPALWSLEYTSTRTEKVFDQVTFHDTGVCRKLKVDTMPNPTQYFSGHL